MARKKILLGNADLRLGDLAAIAREGRGVCIPKEAEAKIRRAGALVGGWVREGRVIYGVTTGFGVLSDVVISREDARQLQQNILMSHAAGVGEPLEEEIVRGSMALRIQDAAQGYGALRLKTVRNLMTLLNKGVWPRVPRKGSVGASGDLAPLAHMALVLIGQGEAVVDGETVSGIHALQHCGLRPLELEVGEGLALVNGTQVMTATAALALYDAIQLGKTTDIAAAMSLEVLMGSRTEFDPRIHRVRPHPGQMASAENMLRMTQKSDIVSSHLDCNRVQDAYTLRCSPQVHGASRDMLHYALGVVETEMNAATGNPLFFPETGEYLLGGNFHGQPVALAMDAVCMAVSELANISERRVERLVNPQLSGLPAFLIADGGLHSGFMIAQYTAASLVSENKVLSHPASVDSIPTSANKEDHVSMGAWAARKCRQVVGNATYVIAIELLCGAQALDLFTNLKPGEGTLAAYRTLRRAVPQLKKDRVLSGDIERVRDLILDGSMVAAVEAKIGPLA